MAPSIGPSVDKYYPEYVEKLPSQEGKVVAVTGTTSGTGYCFAVCAIRKGVKTLMLLNRNSSRSEEALKKLNEEKTKVNSDTDIVPIACDLMSFESVREAAAKINEMCAGEGLHVLANNAGISCFPDDRTKDGYDVQMQTNHLSHFLLMKLLMPSFKAAYDAGKEVRICQQSSVAREWALLEPQYFEKKEEGKLGGNSLRAKTMRYGQSKLANACFAMMLHKKLIEEGYDVTRFKSVLAMPGAAATGLLNNIAGSGGANQSCAGRMAVYMTAFYGRYVTGSHSAGDGSLPIITGCFGDDIDSGDFIHPLKGEYGPPYKGMSKGVVVKGNKRKEKYTLDEKSQKIVWEKSEEALGKFFE